MGDEVSLNVSDEQAGVSRLSVLAGSAMLVQMSLISTPPALGGEEIGDWPDSLDEMPERPCNLSFEDLAGQQGYFRFSGDGVAAAFPSVAKALGEPAAIGLIALSTVVGMRCPGLYSLFAAFTASFVASEGAAVGYRVTRVHRSVRQVLLRVRSHGVDASVRVGARRPPVAQVSFETVRSFVARDAFVGRGTLVIGGSRPAEVLRSSPLRPAKSTPPPSRTKSALAVERARFASMILMPPRMRCSLDSTCI